MSLDQFSKEYYNLRKDFKNIKTGNKGQKIRHLMLFNNIFSNVKKEDRGLDIGVFPGYFPYTLRNIGYNIETIDIYPERINKKIRKKLIIKKCNIETQKIPYPDKIFDYVIFTAILEHMRINPIFTLKEIRRVLKPNGKIFLQTPSLGYWTCRIRVLFGRGFDESPYKAYNRLEELGHCGHIRVYQMHELIEIMKKTGFKIISKKWLHNFHKFPRWSLKEWLDFIIGIYPPFRRQLFVVGKR